MAVKRSPDVQRFPSWCLGFFLTDNTSEKPILHTLCFIVSRRSPTVISNKMALIEEEHLLVECEKCGSDCILKISTAPPKWVSFPCYECPNCPFFIRADLLKMCICGAGYCHIRTSKAEPSKGRQFWCCPNSTGQKDRGCGMFEWLEDENVKMRKKLPWDVDHQSLASSSGTQLQSTKYREGYLDGAIQATENMAKMLKDLKVSLLKEDSAK